MTHTGDRGSIVPMLVFSCFLGLTVIAVIVAATSLYIERKRLFALADGAALASCETVNIDLATFDGDHLHVALDDEGVVKSVRRYLALAVNPRQSVQVISAGAPDAKSARVTLETVWRPPIVGELFPVSLPLRVTATARTAYR